MDTTWPKKNYKLVHKFGSDKPLMHNGQVNLVEYELSFEDNESITLKKVIKDKHRESWFVGVEEEIQSLHKDKTFE